jgi:hypothetical protein
MVVCDGLTGLPDAISAVWPATITQTCVVHLLRNSFRYAGRQHYEAIAKALRPVYTAPTEAAATERFLEFCETWGERYPAIVRLWENAWAEFVPFLSFGACCRIASRRGEHGRLLRDTRRGHRAVAWLSGMSGTVDLEDVEGGGGEVELAGHGVQSAA